MAEILLTLATLLLGVAGFFWWDGTSWGWLIAIFLAMWGAMFAAWGLLALRAPRLLGCIAAISLAAGSAVLGLLFTTGGWWQGGIGCAIGGALGVVAGIWRTRRLVTHQPRG